jgi:hypothetical protein
MRKRIIEDRPADVRIEESNWLDLEHLAQVEITSEAPGYPIESALTPDLGRAGGLCSPESRQFACYLAIL